MPEEAVETPEATPEVAPDTEAAPEADAETTPDATPEKEEGAAKPGLLSPKEEGEKEDKPKEDTAAKEDGEASAAPETYADFSMRDPDSFER